MVLKIQSSADDLPRPWYRCEQVCFVHVDPATIRVLRGTDTMHLQWLYASSALIEEARNRDDLRVLEDPSPIHFESGTFVAPSPHETSDDIDSDHT